MPAEYALELNKARAYPAERPYRDGIVQTSGRSLPFVIERSWVGPAGHYVEQWSIRTKANDVLFRSPPRTISIRGMQSVSTHTDLIDQPLQLEPGTYDLVFVVERRFMGSTQIEVVASDTEAA